MTQLFDKECRVIIVLLDALYEEAIVKDYWAMLVESDGDRIEAVKEFLATMNIACDDMEKQINEENEDLYEITLYLYNKFNSDKIDMDDFRGIKKADRTARESIKDKPNANAKPNYLDLENFDVEATKISETIVQNHDNIENEQNTRKAVKKSEISYQESLESQLLFYKEQLSILEVRTHDLLKKLKIKSIGTSLEGSILAEHDDDLGSIEEITGKLLDYLESPNYRSFEIIQDPNAYQEELKKDSDSVSHNAELDTFVSYSHIPENHIETDVIEYRGVKSSARSTTDKKSEYLSNFGTTKSLKKERAHKPIEKKKDSQRDKIIRISKKKKPDEKEVPKKKDNWCAGVL